MLSTDRHTDRQTGIRSALLGVNNDILRVRGQKNHSRTIKKRIIADSVLEDIRKNRNWSWFRELQHVYSKHGYSKFSLFKLVLLG